MYEYQAKVVKVYDGDTITVDIDLGFNIVQKGVKLRLYGIDTPEIRGGSETTRAKARQARDYVRQIILNDTVTVHTIKDRTGKYGRYLAIVYTAEGVCVNLVLVEKKLAKPYIGYEELEHIIF